MSGYPSISKSKAIPTGNAVVLEVQFTIDPNATSENDVRPKYSCTPYAKCVKLTERFCDVRKRLFTKLFLVAVHERRRAIGSLSDVCKTLEAVGTFGDVCRRHYNKLFALATSTKDGVLEDREKLSPNDGKLTRRHMGQVCSDA